MKKKFLIFGLLFLVILPLGCGKKEETKEEKHEEETPSVIDDQSVKENCVEKNFSQTYSYIYPTYDECINNGNWAFFEISETVDYEVFAYGCEQIEDECGNTYYGVYFNVYQNARILKRYY